jgi:hypothetical protein
MDQWSRLDRLFRIAEDESEAMLGRVGEAEESFRRRVSRLQQLGLIPADAAVTLRRAAEVRNLNHHGKNSANGPIAVPGRHFVDQVASACETLRPTIRLSDRFAKTVEIFLADRPLRDVLLHMREKDFSQVVVDVGRGELHLLTTEDIARWLMDRITEDGEGITLVDSARPIRSALPQRRADTYVFMRSDAWLRDAIEMFRHAAGSGRRLQAILLTRTGKPTPPAIGIVTPHDLPGIAA